MVMHAVSLLSHIAQSLTPHPLIVPWIAIIFAIGFGGIAILIVEIKKSS